MKRSIFNIVLSFALFLSLPLCVHAEEDENSIYEVYTLTTGEEKIIYRDVKDEEGCRVVNGEWNEEGVCIVVEQQETAQPEIIEEPVEEENIVITNNPSEKKEDVQKAEVPKEQAPVVQSIEESTEVPVESKIVKRTCASQELINRYVQPDFKNIDAYGIKNPYTQSNKGQCTWYTWGRFYEVYGYDPGFTGDGCDCVSQLVSKHPKKWEIAEEPIVGSIFSADSEHNHLGMIVGIEDNLYIVQEGNLNGRNDSDDEIEDDCWTQTYTMEELKSCYGEVVFANPKKEVDLSKLLVKEQKKKYSINVDLNSFIERNESHLIENNLQRNVLIRK